MQLTTAQERAYDQAIAMIHDRAESIAQSRHFAEAVRERGYRTKRPSGISASDWRWRA